MNWDDSATSRGDDAELDERPFDEDEALEEETPR